MSQNDLDTVFNSDKPKQLKMVNRLANLHNDIGQVDQVTIKYFLIAIKSNFRH